MASNLLINDLADQLTEMSDKFVVSFEKSMKTEDDYTKFLRGRERWYVGTQQNTQTGSLAQPKAQPQEAEPQQARSAQRRRCPKPRPVKQTVVSKVKMSKLAKVGGIAIGISLIVGGIALALADGPQPGPADAAALPIIIKGANKIVPFIRPLVPVPMAKGGLITKPTKALIGEAGPEIVIPTHKLGDAINNIYKQGSKTMLEATAGFMNSLPSTPTKGKILGEINKLKIAFGLGALKMKKGAKFGIPNPLEWWNKGRNERVENEDTASWKELLEDDLKQRGQSDEGFAKGEKPPMLGRIDHAFNPFRPAEKGGPGSGPTPAVRQAFERPVKGMMNLGMSAAGAIGSAGKAMSAKFKRDKKRSIPTPFDNGRDMLGQRIHLNPAAESGWKKVMRAAAADGVDLPSSVTSAFRNAEEQQEMIENEDDPNIITPAPQGMSPHQQGWAVDIDQGSKANEWMRVHGHKFGWHWEGPKDPVHFDFINNEPREKYLQPDNTDWKPENKSPDNQKREAGTTGGQLLNLIGKTLKGDPPDINETSSQKIDIEPPPPSSSTESVNNTPVEQELKENSVVFGLPIVISGPTKIIPSPPTTLDPDVIRHQVVDQFGKGTRVEVLYV